MKICDTKLVEVNDLSSGQYSVDKNIRFKTSMLRSDLCDYSDAYVVVKGRINNANKRDKMPHLDHAYQKLITHL